MDKWKSIAIVGVWVGAGLGMAFARNEAQSIACSAMIATIAICIFT